MIIVSILLAFIFIGIGFLISEKNAKYLLSGYNTMSEEDKKNFNLTEYLKFFRKFHICFNYYGGCIRRNYCNVCLQPSR